jgi:hypothetical protein
MLGLVSDAYATNRVLQWRWIWIQGFTQRQAAWALLITCN